MAYVQPAPGNGGAPAEVAAWDLQSGKRLLTDQPDSKTADVNGVVYTPDGDCLIYAAGPEVKRWDGLGLKPIPRWKINAGADVRAIAISPDGRRLAIAVAAGDGVAVRLLDAADGRQNGVLGSQPGAVQGLAFSPDGKRLVGSGPSAHVWDMEANREVAAFDGITGPVSFSPDGACLVRREGSPGVWDAGTGAEMVTLAERRKAFPGGRTVETRDEQHSLLYDVATGQPILEWPYAVSCQAFSPDGRRLVVASDGQVRLLDAQAGEAGFLQAAPFGDGDDHGEPLNGVPGSEPIRPPKEEIKSQPMEGKSPPMDKEK
jgi:WD40 repeat protein